MACGTQRSFLSAAVLAVVVVALMSETVTAAPSSGRCSFSSEEWQHIVFSMCRGRLKKRSIDDSLTNALGGEALVAIIIAIIVMIRIQLIILF